MRTHNLTSEQRRALEVMDTSMWKNGFEMRVSVDVLNHLVKIGLAQRDGQYYRKFKGNKSRG